MRSGRLADIFSLGAVFLEMCASRESGGLAELKKIRQSRGDWSYSGNLDRIFKWIDRDLDSPFTKKQCAISCLHYTFKQMLQKRRIHRPSAAALQACLSYKSLFELPKCSCKSGPLGIKSTQHNTGGTEANSQNAAEVDLSLVKGVLQWMNGSHRSIGHVLLEAAAYGHETVVFHLLQHGVDIEQRDSRLMALYLAAFYGYTGVVRLLLSHGARIDVKSPEGLTALYLGATNGHEATVRELVENGADVQEHLGTLRATPLMVAASVGSKGVVLDLLKRGANVNAQAADGWTALHYAAVLEKEEAARLLLEEGADINIRASNGETAVDVATRKGDEGVARLLRSAQTRV